MSMFTFLKEKKKDKRSFVEATIFTKENMQLLRDRVVRFKYARDAIAEG